MSVVNPLKSYNVAEREKEEKKASGNGRINRGQSLEYACACVFILLATD